MGFAKYPKIMDNVLFGTYTGKPRVYKRGMKSIASLDVARTEKTKFCVGDTLIVFDGIL